MEGAHTLKLVPFNLEACVLSRFGKTELAFDVRNVNTRWFKVYVWK